MPQTLSNTKKKTLKKVGDNNSEFDWKRVAKLVLTARTIDEIEENELVPAGKVTYQFSSKGHELAQVLLGLSLNHPHDGATVYYRSRPFMLASGLTIRETFAANMARTGSPSEGRDVGVVYSMPGRRGATILPSSGDVGAQYTPAAGWAQAIEYHRNELKNKEWEGAMSVALGGDGSVATSGFWSALIIATTLSLPMLFFIEDNGYGISVPSHFQTPGGNIAKNLQSFANLKILDGSGTEPEEAAELIQKAVAHVRSGAGACLLRVKVPRLSGHTFGEDQTAYKSGKQIKAEKLNNPVTILKDYLSNSIDWQALIEEVDIEVREELAKAENNPDPALDSAAQHLFYTGTPAEVPPADRKLPSPDFSLPPKTDSARINFSEAIRNVMDHELSINPKLMIFGEDVGIRGGVHRVTLDLQNKFGETRVFDTSLSEEGIMGRAIGLALAGLRPLPEMQFRKYADPATEQINDIGWIRWRTAGKFAAPIVVRIPVGYSKKTGDPWHSVSGEAVYAHTLGWRIAFPSNAADAAGLLRTALREQDPTIFLEHRALLDTPPSRRPYPGNDYALPFGKAKIVQSGSELTVVTWGEMVYRCLDAAMPFKQDVEIIDLRTIMPWDKDTVAQSVAKTGKCLVAHEDTRTGGFAAEIIATVSEEVFTELDAPVRRVTTIDTPIPFNIALMDTVIPTVEEIRNQMEELLNW